MALRVYADTSVFGGCEDEEFREGSRRLMELARSGRVRVVISALTLQELLPAPRPVRAHLHALPLSTVEFVVADPRVDLLLAAYSAAGLVTPMTRPDAEHIALATLAKVDLLVSWNFRHIVQPRRISIFHRIHRELGHEEIAIVSPDQVLPHD